MTRRRVASWAACWAVKLSPLALSSALGCESQVNDDYTGEPLLSLQGNVVLREKQAEVDQVPYLAFFGSDEAGDFLYLVDGELSGGYPGLFRFEVTQPPADEVLYQLPSEEGFTSRGTSGLLVMLPPNSAGRLPMISEVWSYPVECTDDGTACTSIERICNDNGSCRERYQVCSIDPCELVEQLGDPVLGATTTYQSHYRCNSTSCYSIVSVCDDEAAHCSMDVYRCELPEGGTFEDAFDGTVKTCGVLNETGDASLRSFLDLNTVAVDYAILYVADDNPETVYGPLERGYHLLKKSDSLEGWLESERCEFTAMEAALAEYNLEHETNYHQLDPDIETLSLDVAAVEKCRSIKVIRHPLAEVLTIELGKPQPF